MIDRASLLEAYKAYDCLNADVAHPIIKIFVSYIKPSFLFKSRILTPIHLGRAVETANSKDGEISKTDVRWLHQNCIGDDDVEGSLSPLNRRIGFFTGTYWAWKNYERLGSPDYFGSFGYRKFLAPSCLSRLSDYDAILPQPEKFRMTIKEHFHYWHGDDGLKMLTNIIENCFSARERTCFEEYANSSKGYFHELYILRKELFFDFCEWMYSKLLFLLERYPFMIPGIATQFSPRPIDEVAEHLKDFLGNETYTQCEQELRNKQCKSEKRDIAYVFERLTGFYLYDKIVHSGLRYLEADVINYAGLAEANSPFRLAVISKMRNRARAVNRT